MPDSRTQIQFEAPAHPMPGWLAVMAVLPEQKREPEDEAVAEHKTTAINSPLGGLLQAMGIPAERMEMHELNVAHAPGPDIASAIVVEVGELPGQDALNIFSPGCSVYYRADKGIPIGDYEYLSIQSIIAWRPQPETHG